MDAEELLPLVGAIPIITALIQIVKSTLPGLGVRFIPIITLALGVAWTTLLSDDPGSRATIIVGILTGLSASGFYEASRAIVNPTDERDREIRLLHDELRVKDQMLAGAFARRGTPPEGGFGPDL